MTYQFNVNLYARWKMRRTLKSFRVIHGLKPEQLQEALEGKDVGTLVYSTRYEK